MEPAVTGPCCSIDLAWSQPELFLNSSVSTRTGYKALDVRTAVCSPLHPALLPQHSPWHRGPVSPAFFGGVAGSSVSHVWKFTFRVQGQ